MYNKNKIQCFFFLLNIFALPLHADSTPDLAKAAAANRLVAMEKNTPFSRASMVLFSSRDCIANYKLAVEKKTNEDLLHLIQENEIAIALIQLIIEKMAVASEEVKTEQYDYNETKAREALASSMKIQSQMWEKYNALKVIANAEAEARARKGASAEVLASTLGERADLLPVVAIKPVEAISEH